MRKIHFAYIEVAQTRKNELYYFVLQCFWGYKISLSSTIRQNKMLFIRGITEESLHPFFPVAVIKFSPTEGSDELVNIRVSFSLTLKYLRSSFTGWKI